MTHFDVGLPKWPAMVVAGDPVTREQAAEIIVRTGRWPISTNDKDFERQVYAALGIKGEPRGHSYVDYWEAADAFRAEIGALDLEYLGNDRIASCWIGGPHGWCNWNGRIASSNYNIGKWPSVSAVWAEWGSIAQAFPFLNLWCQLFSGETCEEGVRPVVEFVVANGEATVGPPTDRKVSPEELDSSRVGALFAPGRERGCTVDAVVSTVAAIKAKRGAS